MDSQSALERRQVEIELLQAMYPDQIHFDPRTLELRYTSASGGCVTFRIPESYPERGLPDVISAATALKHDARVRIKAVLSESATAEGEEVLDTFVQACEEPLNSAVDTRTNEADNTAQSQKQKGHSKKEWKTVIIWLHHLLNTNKRKLALNPTFHAAAENGIVSGITKPGYPGILVYSGPADAVNTHVAELRQQRWQAFQVRYEEGHGKAQGWNFVQGFGIQEVESMSDIVQSIVGETNREAFLKAVGVK